MKIYAFERITHPEMARHALQRYAVMRHGDGRFLGEVFEFRPSLDEAWRWMAQTPDGTLLGYLSRLNTRHQAAIALGLEVRQR